MSIVNWHHFLVIYPSLDTCTHRYELVGSQIVILLNWGRFQVQLECKLFIKEAIFSLAQQCSIHSCYEVLVLFWLFPCFIPMWKLKEIRDSMNFPHSEHWKLSSLPSCCLANSSLCRLSMCRVSTLLFPLHEQSNRSPLCRRM